MTDADREYMQALFDMSEQIDLRCNSCCDICFQRQLCEAVVSMKSYVEGRMKEYEQTAAGNHGTA